MRQKCRLSMVFGGRAALRALVSLTFIVFAGRARPVASRKKHKYPNARNVKRDDELIDVIRISRALPAHQ